MLLKLEQHWVVRSQRSVARRIHCLLIVTGVFYRLVVAARERISRLELDENEPMESHYRTLGIDPSASPEELQEVYADLLKKNHPDRNPNADPSRFQEIHEAYNAIVEHKPTIPTDDSFSRVVTNVSESLGWLNTEEEEKLSELIRQAVGGSGVDTEAIEGLGFHASSILKRNVREKYPSACEALGFIADVLFQTTLF